MVVSSSLNNQDPCLFITCAEIAKQMVQWSCKHVWGPYENMLESFQKQIWFVWRSDQNGAKKGERHGKSSFCHLELQRTFRTACTYNSGIAFNLNNTVAGQCTRLLYCIQLVNAIQLKLSVCSSREFGAGQ
jgi:hypothetical protein